MSARPPTASPPTEPRGGGDSATAPHHHRARSTFIGCRELSKAPLHSVHDRISNHGAVAWVVTFENDRCTVRSMTVLSKLLDVRYVDDVQRGVLLEGAQRNDLGAARPASTP